MEDETHILIRNIPRSLHSKDLREFFSESVETVKFICFHFLHRAEKKLDVIGKVELTPPVSSSPDVCCCVVKLAKINSNAIRQKYNGKPWAIGLPVCIIQPFPPDQKLDFEKLLELHPPPVMVNGNVGTPSSVFLEEIRQCKLPTSLIAKLGLRFPKAIGRKYANVPFTYDKKKEKSDKDTESSSDDADSCEEWERHEATTDDPSNQERLAERLYEEPLEVVWEKGGSGLVFYTDAQHWDELAGDFDDKTADDHDVDMSVYYEGWETGDMDARQRIEMAESDRLAAGAFQPKRDSRPPVRRRQRSRSRSPVAGPSGSASDKPVGGFGKQLLESCGWKQGQGLGRNCQGISEPIEADGQGPRERVGFGFRGAKMDLKSAVAAAKRAAEARRGPRLVATIYDKPQPDAKDLGIFRRPDHYTLRNRTDDALPSSSSKPTGATGMSSTDYR